MKTHVRKAAIALLPLTIGAAILFRGGRNSGSPSSGPAPHAAEGAPQDKIHEKAGLEADLKRNPGHAPILLRLAEMAREEGHPDKAVAHLRQILEKDPKHEEARLELGRALYEVSDVEGSLRETEQLVKYHPNNVDGLYNLGAINANLGRFDSARDYWNRAVAAGPDTDSGRRSRDSLAKIGQGGQPAEAKAPHAAIDPKIGELLDNMVRRR